MKAFEFPTEDLEEEVKENMPEAPEPAAARNAKINDKEESEAKDETSSKADERKKRKFKK